MKDPKIENKDKGYDISNNLEDALYWDIYYDE